MRFLFRIHRSPFIVHRSLLTLLTLLPFLTAFLSHLRAQPPDLFANETERRGFLKALEERDAAYDPAEQMIRRPFSSPGYHTTLKGGAVHPTRDSFAYAVALLDSGDPKRLDRAVAILRRAIALQDQDPNSKTYGIWSWFLEEPLATMSPPDWNWADFCGVQLLQVARDHAPRLPKDLQDKVRDSILHAAQSIKRRNVGPGYTNIALMGTYVTLVAGEAFGVAELTDYGKARLKTFCDATIPDGSFAEYNSPTYTIVAITEISRMLGHVRDPKSSEMLEELNRFAWRHVARRFHPPTRQWAGPHSRCYNTILSDRTLAFIQRATGGKAHFVSDEEAATSLDACRLRAKCPDDLVHYFTSLPDARQEREVFVKGGEDRTATIGTTWLHPDFALGTANLENLWNQCRPLVAYFKTDQGVAALRLRCLHDGYDYSSGAFFSVQDQGDVLAAVDFATDGGDTHPGLDRVKNATIQAKDFRLRFEIEGDLGQIRLPEKPDLREPIRLRLGDVVCDIKIGRCVFGDFPIRTEAAAHETGDEEGRRKSLGLDLVLYSGEKRDLSFRELTEAAAVFALSMKPAAESSGKPFSGFTTDRNQGQIVATWRRDGRPEMVLTVAEKPATFGALRSAANGQLGDTDAWK
jgi:hypothetical protein